MTKPRRRWSDWPLTRVPTPGLRMSLSRCSAWPPERVIDFREYENGVADILSFLVGGSATVERNVRLPSRRGSGARQVDVLVRVRVFGLDDRTLAVDCKHWKRTIAVNDIDQFVGFVDDIAVDLGLLVASSGYTPAAKSRLRHVRGVQAEIVTIAELSAWSPNGTIHVSFRLPAGDAGRESRVLREAGMRVRPDPALARSADEVVLVAFGHFGEPSGEAQRDLSLRAIAALRDAGLPVDTAGSGVSIGGGTPAHRWLEVTDSAGLRLGLKLLAASEHDVQLELGRIAASLAVAEGSLDVERPPGWPPTGLFGLAS